MGHVTDFTRDLAKPEHVRFLEKVPRRKASALVLHLLQLSIDLLSIRDCRLGVGVRVDKEANLDPTDIHVIVSSAILASLSDAELVRPEST